MGARNSAEIEGTQHNKKAIEDKTRTTRQKAKKKQKPEEKQGHHHRRRVQSSQYSRADHCTVALSTFFFHLLFCFLCFSEFCFPLAFFAVLSFFPSPITMLNVSAFPLLRTLYVFPLASLRYRVSHSFFNTRCFSTLAQTTSCPALAPERFFFVFFNSSLASRFCLARGALRLRFMHHRESERMRWKR